MGVSLGVANVGQLLTSFQQFKRPPAWQSTPIIDLGNVCTLSESKDGMLVNIRKVH